MLLKHLLYHINREAVIKRKFETDALKCLLKIGYGLHHKLQCWPALIGMVLDLPGIKDKARQHKS
jgi:hypothetical protein